MKTITIHVICRNSSKTMTRSIDITNKTVEQLDTIRNDFFDSIPYSRWYYQVECFDTLTKEDESVLEQCNLSIDF